MHTPPQRRVSPIIPIELMSFNSNFISETPLTNQNHVAYFALKASTKLIDMFWKDLHIISFIVRIRSKMVRVEREYDEVAITS